MGQLGRGAVEADTVVPMGHMVVMSDSAARCGRQCKYPSETGLGMAVRQKAIVCGRLLRRKEN